MMRRAARFLMLAGMFMPASPLYAWQEGELKAHNHASTTDGGGLSNLSVSGTLSAGTAPDKSTFTATGALRVGGTGVSYFNGGNVGIGTTSPGASLQIGTRGSSASSDISTIAEFGASGSGTAVYPLTLENTASVGTNNETYLTFITAGLASAQAAISAIAEDANYRTGLRFQTWQPSALGERMRITSAGNVGIGTTNPLTPLQVNGTSTDNNTALDASNILNVYGSATNRLLFGAKASSPYGLWVRTNSTSYPILLQPDGGNVGIGTVAPGAKLEVSGDITLGPGTAAQSGSRNALSVRAKSVDNVSQSSGCAVAMWVTSGEADGVLVFTSTTTSGAGPVLGVLMETCAPGAFCSVAYSGLVRAQGVAGGGTGGVVTVLSTTRCALNYVTPGSANVEGGRMISVEGSGNYWVLLGTR